MPKRAGNKVSQDLAGKPVSASRTEMTEVVLPQDANVFGNILGGRVMHLVDIAAAITAHRHCRSMAVTASVDHIDFRNPIRVGEVIMLKASLNRAFHTSMEIGVKVFSEDILTGERKHTTSAYVTFVALDRSLAGVGAGGLLLVLHLHFAVLQLHLLNFPRRSGILVLPLRQRYLSTYSRPSGTTSRGRTYFRPTRSRP